MKLPRLFLIGTGVGRDLRGFEAHIQDLFERVKNEQGYEAVMVKGAGSSDDRQVSVINIHRKSWFARLLGSLTGRHPHFIQQASFFVGLIPVLYRYKPSVLYLGEPVLYHYLYRWRNFSGMKFRMIFYTGGNTVPTKMGQGDFLQLVTPVLISLAQKRGVLESQMKVIPHFINATRESNTLTEQATSELRKNLGIPSDKPILLSVGAVDSSVKRMDYLIHEVSKLKAPYFLVILGEYERETPAIRKLAEMKLGKGNFLINRLPRKELISYYQAADIFILASYNEGFGLVTLEALLHGLPVLVHQHAVSQFVLGEMGSLSDFSKEGNLTRLIESTLSQIHRKDEAGKRKKYVLDHFSWEALASDYRQMFKNAMVKSE